MVVIDDAEKSRRWTQLMERVQDGDQQAFRALFDEVGPLIARFVRRRVADQTEAEDVCQEALIAIFKSRHTYQHARPFEPWLYAFVRNVISRSFSHSLQRPRWQDTVSELAAGEGQGHSVKGLQRRKAFV